MHRSFLTKTILSIFLVLSILVLYWSINKKDEPTPPSVAQKRPEQRTSHHPFSMKGITFSSYDENSNLLVKIEADNIAIGKRKFWIFNVRPFNEVIINNARLELYLYNDGSSVADIYSPTKNLIGSDMTGNKEGGVITRGVINRIRFSIFSSGRKSISVSADKAYIDFKKKKLKFLRATIKDMVQERLIKGDVVFWNDKDRTFDIPGEYVEIGHDKRSKGKGLTLRALEL